MINIAFFTGIILTGAVLFYLRYYLLIASIPKKLERAKELIAMGDEDSLKYLSMVLEIDKKNLEANWLMAQYHITNKRYILALSFLNEIEASRRFNSSVTENLVRESLCLIYLNLGTIEKAMAQIRMMAGKEQIPRYLYVKLVKTLLDLNRYRDALIIIEQARIEIPDDGEFEFLHGLVLQKKQENAQALIHFENAIIKGYSGEECFYLAGKCAFLANNFQKACEYLPRVSSEEFDKPELYNLLGQSYYNINKYDTAIEILTSANLRKEDDPNFAGIYYYLGLSWEKKGDFENALTAWQKVDKKYSYYDAAQEKNHFYTKVASGKKERDFFLADIDTFFLVIQNIFRKLDYVIKETVKQSSECMEFICTSRRDTLTFALYYVVVSRATNSVTQSDIRLAEKRCEAKKCKYLTFIAGYFSADTETYATGKPIELIDISILKK